MEPPSSVECMVAGSLFYCIAPFLHPSFHVSLISCIPFLLPAIPAYLQSCISPVLLFILPVLHPLVLHLSCPTSSISCILSGPASCPASLLPCVPHILISSIQPSSPILSCIHPDLHQFCHASVPSYMHPVQHKPCPVYILQGLPPVLFPSCPAYLLSLLPLVFPPSCSASCTYHLLCPCYFNFAGTAFIIKSIMSPPPLCSTCPMPMFSVRTWMFETEKKGLIYGGFDWNHFGIIVDISKNALLSILKLLRSNLRNIILIYAFFFIINHVSF